jgi:hypothetical protein
MSQFCGAGDQRIGFQGVKLSGTPDPLLLYNGLIPWRLCPLVGERQCLSFLTCHSPSGSRCLWCLPSLLPCLGPVPFCACLALPERTSGSYYVSQAEMQLVW